MKPHILLLASLSLLSFTLLGQQTEVDWAGFSKYQDANKQITQRVDVVFMGNSITEFWVKTHPEFFSTHNYLGRGISGQTSSQMLVRFRDDVLALHPKCVVILAGINDIARNNGIISLENVLGNIASMTELAQLHDIKVILCSVLPASSFPWRKELTPADSVRRLNTLIETYARTHKIDYVDFYTPMADAQGGLPKELASDGVHPTANGYHLMEKILTPHIDKAILQE